MLIPSGDKLGTLAAQLLFCVVVACVTIPARSAQPGHKIVLIGGPTSTYVRGSHDYPNNVRFVELALRESPQIAAHSDLFIEAHPHDWPATRDLEGAATLVLDFAGVDRHPLLDRRNMQVVEQLMRQGVGLVALHQSFTLPESDTSVPLADWLGGARYGMADRTTQPVEILVSSDAHPLTRGLASFVHYDEYYPTIRFNRSSGRLTPIWSAELPIHYVKGEPSTGADVATYTLAWAYERDNGGRSFAYSGGHYLESWDDAQARTLLLNAILWTAGKDVPLEGATTAAPINAAEQLVYPHLGRGRVTEAVVSRPGDHETIEMPWGRIEWHASGPLGNSDSMTTGVATIFPDQSNPLHYHPNCDEILHVLQGHIRHRMDDVIVEMKTGDTVSIPKGVRHNAVNIGEEEAVLAISFSTAWREVVGE